MSYKGLTLRGVDYARANPEKVERALKDARELINYLIYRQYDAAEVFLAKKACGFPADPEPHAVKMLAPLGACFALFSESN